MNSINTTLADRNLAATTMAAKLAEAANTKFQVQNQTTSNTIFDPQKSLDKLRQQIAQPQINDSLGGLEGTKLEEFNRQEPQPSPVLNFMRNKLPFYGACFASAMHVVAGTSKSLKILPEGMRNFFHQYSTMVSKWVNTANYVAKGSEAVYHGRAWDGLGRLAYPLAVLFADQNDVYLSSGLSSGITMMEQGQRHKKAGKEINGLVEDFIENCKAWPVMMKEVIAGGLFGPNRKVFLPESREKGHTCFLGAHGNILGALLGILAGKGKSPLKNVATIVRNIGSFICDFGKIVSPDMNNRASGLLYGLVSVLDVAQAYSPEPYASIISHFSLAINNVANYFYVNTTKATTDKKYKDYAGNDQILSTKEQEEPKQFYSLVKDPKEVTEHHQHMAQTALAA